jgi:hypothetical protein
MRRTAQARSLVKGKTVVIRRELAKSCTTSTSSTLEPGFWKRHANNIWLGRCSHKHGPLAECPLLGRTIEMAGMT